MTAPEYLAAGEPFDPATFQLEVNGDAVRGLVVLGRRWFDSAGGGNTYHSVAVYAIPGGFVGANLFEYGYGDQWQSTALELLERVGVLPVIRYASNSVPLALWRVRDLLGLELVTDVVDVGRRADLHHSGEVG